MLYLPSSGKLENRTTHEPVGCPARTLTLERRVSQEVRPTFALVFCWSTFPALVPGGREPGRAWCSPEFRAAEKAGICMVGSWGGGSHGRCVHIQPGRVSSSCSQAGQGGRQPSSYNYDLKKISEKDTCVS